MGPTKRIHCDDPPTAATIMFPDGLVLRLPRAPALPTHTFAYDGQLYPGVLPAVPPDATLVQEGVAHAVLTTPGTTRDIRRIILTRPCTLEEVTRECETYLHMSTDAKHLRTLSPTVAALSEAMRKTQHLAPVIHARLGTAAPRHMPLQQVLMAVLGGRVPVSDLTDAQRAQYRDAIYWSDRSVQCAPSLAATAAQVCAYYRAARHVPTFRQPYGHTQHRQRIIDAPRHRRKT
jgi:hypothetical protein